MVFVLQELNYQNENSMQVDLCLEVKKALPSAVPQNSTTAGNKWQNLMEPLSTLSSQKYLLKSPKFTWFQNHTNHLVTGEMRRMQRNDGMCLNQVT